MLLTNFFGPRSPDISPPNFFGPRPDVPALPEPGD
jgi:hypothetical protein